jgi:hypothetical protein
MLGTSHNFPTMLGTSHNFPSMLGTSHNFPTMLGNMLAKIYKKLTNIDLILLQKGKICQQQVRQRDQF